MSSASSGWIAFGWKYDAFASFDDDVRVRLEQEPAQRAAQERSRDQAFAVEGGLGVELFVHGPITPRASELSVEGILRLRSRREDVVVSLDDPSRDLGVHLFESAHVGTVASMESVHARQLQS